MKERLGVGGLFNKTAMKRGSSSHDCSKQRENVAQQAEFLKRGNLFRNVCGRMHIETDHKEANSLTL